MNTLRIISFRKSRSVTMKCTVIFVFGDARRKNNLLISDFTIFESLLLEGFHANVFKLCMRTSFEVVFLVIWFIS